MNRRRLTPGETALARQAFGAALDPARARLFTGVPTGGFAFVLWRWMIFPAAVEDFAAEPIEIQAWFIHELTHLQQFQTPRSGP